MNSWSEHWVRDVRESEQRPIWYAVLTNFVSESSDSLLLAFSDRGAASHHFYPLQYHLFLPDVDGVLYVTDADDKGS